MLKSIEHEKKVMLEYGNLMILKLSCSLGKCAPLFVEVHCLEKVIFYVTKKRFELNTS